MVLGNAKVNDPRVSDKISDLMVCVIKKDDKNVADLCDTFSWIHLISAIFFPSFFLLKSQFLLKNLEKPKV